MEHVQLQIDFGNDSAGVPVVSPEDLHPGIPQGAREAMAAAYNTAGVRPGDALHGDDADQRRRDDVNDAKFALAAIRKKRYWR